MRSLIWFRKDYRLENNRAFQAALGRTTCVGGILLRIHHAWPGFPALQTGKCRETFESECEQELTEALTAKQLRLWHANSVESFVQILLDENIDILYVSMGVSPNEKWEFIAVQQHLHRLGIVCYEVQNHELFERTHWPQKPKRGFKSYSEWKRDCPVNVDFENTTMPNHHDSAVKQHGFKGGRTEGLNQLRQYFQNSDGLSRYAETRNGLLGDTYSSRLSPWLAFGCLDVREVWHHVSAVERQCGPSSSTETFKKELLWREYFRWVMDTHGALLFRSAGIRSNATAWRHSESDFEAWCEGRTGSAFINAMMQELNTTGFMGNRARQIAASYLINELRIDWRWGASYFESQLIDYDVSSNYGNWAYIAGVGTDPRGGRHFNIQYQEQQHDPEGAYQSFWNKKTIHA